MDLLNGVINLFKGTVGTILVVPPGTGNGEPQEDFEELLVRPPSAAPSQSLSSIASCTSSQEFAKQKSRRRWIQDRDASWIERNQHVKLQSAHWKAQRCAAEARLEKVRSHLNELKKWQSRKGHKDKELPKTEFNKKVHRHLVEVNCLAAILKNSHQQAAEVQAHKINNREKKIAIFSGGTGSSSKQAHRGAVCVWRDSLVRCASAPTARLVRSTSPMRQKQPTLT